MTTSPLQSPATEAADLLRHFNCEGGRQLSGNLCPIDGSRLPGLAPTNGEELQRVLADAKAAFERWAGVPAPKRGEAVRLFGVALREHKERLARLVTLETGKIASEALGEVQEMIDMCDFAAGLSRQLYGLTIVSERPHHHMRESWHPLGPVAIISAFNFPVAVWAWNAALALICGDSIIWKPSPKAPLSAAAAHQILLRTLSTLNHAPAHVSQLVLGGVDLGRTLVSDQRIALVSATGSIEMGRDVGQKVAARFGRSLLELGGNAAAIVTPSADLDLALRGILFSAVGTSGQRCTSLRRLLIHERMYETLTDRLLAAYGSLKIGDPRMDDTLVGPLIDADASAQMKACLEEARAAGATVHGGEALERPGFYVRPAIVEAPRPLPMMSRETFAPVLYCLRYAELTDAISILRDVPQGLSSALFTNDVREAELFLSHAGSDCGLANINMGTSGAEIGGAFGGEKETGGGREAGSDAWRAYMRRQTQTVNFGRDLPLAQGVVFS